MRLRALPLHPRFAPPHTHRAHAHRAWCRTVTVTPAHPALPSAATCHGLHTFPGSTAGSPRIRVPLPWARLHTADCLTCRATHTHAVPRFCYLCVTQVLPHTHCGSPLHTTCLHTATCTPPGATFPLPPIPNGTTGVGIYCLPTPFAWLTLPTSQFRITITTHLDTRDCTFVLCHTHLCPTHLGPYTPHHMGLPHYPHCALHLLPFPIHWDIVPTYPCPTPPHRVYAGLPHRLFSPWRCPLLPAYPTVPLLCFDTHTLPTPTTHPCPHRLNSLYYYNALPLPPAIAPCVTVALDYAAFYHHLHTTDTTHYARAATTAAAARSTVAPPPLPRQAAPHAVPHCYACRV